MKPYRFEDKLKTFELENFGKNIQWIESQYLNLIYNPMFDKIQTRDEYEKTKDLVEWECAICGKPIFMSQKRNDVENFVCDECRKTYNNKNRSVDVRILNSRTKMYRMMEDTIYQELEDYLGGE